MTTAIHSHSMTPVGYLIVQDSGGLSLIGSTKKRYFGVDRLPPLIAPDPMIRQEVGEPLVENERLKDALEQLFDLKEVKTPFLQNLMKAIQLRDALQLSGLRLELLFCDVVNDSDAQKRSSAFPTVSEDRPAISSTYGYDVSWPSCTHSAIRQPGVVPGSTVWQERLNERGLLSNYTDAAALREEYLRVYQYPPFDIFLVHKIDVAVG